MKKKKIINVFLGTIMGIFLFASCTSTNGETPKVEIPTPKTDTVIIEQMQYFPDTITINLGDTLVFINRDIVPHDVTEKDKKWNSEPLKMDDTWKIVPQESADYYCSIHMVMTGRVNVTNP